ncbi:predicted protein [Scheffersomyces stipitis CBS 6054]|uniref:Uncharacterized protein n=1 Tax=Scheffersomyces stipitis (strain ATCC 58785 / CBS 6054 / NBRC 10063 / NRRL Y-11545) TaxID=322104 RepID=A3LUY8_PICST|nr:predicted protein [Scheffersomyces stipitis CBS 6054]ABN67038.2 predicted protein [Scheffersomyces stipitis CBS 6054]KAG2731278.1 hypothetical protein G9P44_005694 [Scheffersomyces stipitis]
MIVGSFRYKSSHQTALFSLYRSLVRNIGKLNNIDILQDSEHIKGCKDIANELEKIKLDQKQYFSNLRFELLYSIRNEFQKQKQEPFKLTSQAVADSRFVQQFEMGIRLDQLLDKFVQEKSIIELLTFVLEYRSSQFKKQKWRADYLRRREEIDKKIHREREVNKKKAKYKPQLKKPVDPLKIYHKLDNRQKRLVIDNERRRSSVHSNHLLRRFLKLKQASGEIPTPQLLPYTSESNGISADSMSNVHHVPKGSTANAAIQTAYDMEYIKAVVIPSLEFDINKKHFLEKISHTVNEKGPSKVQVRTTNAAFTTLSFLQLPYPTIPQLEKIAVDFKKSLFVARLQNIWESSPGKMKDENLLADGSYSVKGSGGFGPDECIYPRHHYQRLAEGEALWEYLMNRNDKTPLKAYVKDWTIALDITSSELASKADEIKKKYNDLRRPNSKLYEEKERKQQQMFTHFDKLSVSYGDLIAKLNEKQVHKHSDIVNLGDKIRKTYDKRLGNHSMTRKTYRGIPNIEGVGMGKALGDYLDEAGLPCFKWGDEFYDHFDF